MKVTVCILVALCVIAVCTARPRGGKGGRRGPNRGGRGHGDDPPHRHGKVTGEPPHRHGEFTGEPSHRHGDFTGEPPHRHGHHGKHDHTDGPPSETTAADSDA